MPKILSGSALKLIALVSMCIDHTAGCLLKQCDRFVETWFTFGHTHFSWYFILRGIGRLAFPIFAFLLVEGFLHTSNKKKYGLNLLAFALLSQVPFNLEHTGHVFGLGQNVFFTLFLGFVALYIIDKYKNEYLIQKKYLLLLLPLTWLVHADYGLSGLGFIIMLYLLRDSLLYQAVIGSCFLSSTWVAGLAFVPISMYNGQRGFIKGKFLKYFFYAIYPFSFFVLYYLRLHYFGGYK